jgi:hypothetical protein
MREDGQVGVVLDEAMRVLGHSELGEPVRNLLHRRLHAGFSGSHPSQELSDLSPGAFHLARHHESALGHGLPIREQRRAADGHTIHICALSRLTRT